MDQHYFLVCLVNSQNEEKLAGQGGSCLRLLTNPTYPRWTCISPFGVRLSEAYTVVPNMRSTIMRSSTSSTTTRTAWWSVCTLIFLISDKVHIYSGEGRKTAAQHVMMISINHARIYISLRASPSVCSRSSSLSRNGGLALCRQSRSVCSHSCPTCQ